MKQLTILFLFIMTLLTSSCSYQRKENENHNLLKEYNLFLLKLDSTEISTVPTAVAKYQTLFKNTSIGLKDSAFVLFSSYYEKVDRNINQSMEKDTTNFDPLISLDSEMNPLPISEKLKKYKDRIEQNGFEISSTEGMAYLKQNRDYIANNFYDYVSRTMRVYLEELNKENKEVFQEDAEITIEPQAFVDRLIWWDKFIGNNTNFIMIKNAEENRKYLLTFLIIGMDNTQVLSNDSSEINEYYKTAYTYLLSNYPKSETAKIILPYFKALLQKDIAKSEKIVNDYKRSNLIIDFHQ